MRQVKGALAREYTDIDIFEAIVKYTEQRMAREENKTACVSNEENERKLCLESQTSYRFIFLSTDVENAS